MSAAADRFRELVVDRTINGPGMAGSASRRAAFDNHGVDEAARALIDKVARHAWTVTDADVVAAKAAGVREDEIFELTVCAALGQATRQLDAALAVLDTVTNPGAAHGETNDPANHGGRP